MSNISDYHKLSSDTFQDFIADLFNATENTNTYSIWGRNGQKQQGVDIYSPETGTAIQCKYKTEANNSLTRKLLEKEMAENAALVAQLGIPIKHFIVVSTFRHDAALQHFALSLRDRKKYDFNISYIGWDLLKRWALQQPILLKRYFGNLLKPEMIELVSIQVDSEACSWAPYKEGNNMFFDRRTEASPYPIFDFTFVNHYNKTVVLKSIHLFSRSLWSGFSGIPQPSIVSSLFTYCIRFHDDQENILITNPPIQAGADQAFRFKLQLIPGEAQESYPILERKVLFFGFDFNSDIKVTAPAVYLNTQNNNRGVTVFRLG